MKKLIFCDIDGTIIDGSRNLNELTQKTRTAIRKLCVDNYVFIASGRCKGLLDKQIIDLHPNGYILCNGAYGEMDEKEIYSLTFDKETVELIKKISLDNGGFYLLESINEIYVENLHNPAFELFMDTWGATLGGFRTDDNVFRDYNIAMIGFTSEEMVLKTQNELGPFTNLGRHHGGFLSFDVNIKGVDKGLGVRKMMEHLGISKEDTYCFGDGINDLEMLQSVGHPVIMANSDERLKTYGFEETDDVLEDGFYRYLIRKGLIDD